MIYSIEAKNIQNSEMPLGFINQQTQFSNLINDKAVYIKQDNSIYKIMTSIQWFMHNQEYLYLIIQAFRCFNTFFRQNLKQVPTYLRASGNLGLYMLCNVFLRVFYSLSMKKKAFQLKEEYVENLEKCGEEIQSNLESDLIEVWTTGFNLNYQ
ncbi:unnamed protein product [Paramecium octaurelia]|uniref:Uncharacterized protein n=1 Tax=Paramecium octaurelia TaxID=43137 RepID=A0A8S1T325_PAROT|nr:unnamed protein product [Paramecium octaurelia]